MAVNDPKSERLYVEAPLSAGAEIVLAPEPSHYLVNVLRAKPGATLLVFNGSDGEWQAELIDAHKKAARLAIGDRTRAQADGPEIQYLFAPLKRARLDYMVQKATELGVAALTPVMTRYTVAERVNTARMRANAIEAAEQCGVLRIPRIDEPQRLADVLSAWPEERTLVFCDEAAECTNPIAALQALTPGPVALLIGPEGGFADEERARILKLKSVCRLSLGPRVMRADTAAVAALALLNAVHGDW